MSSVRNFIKNLPVADLGKGNESVVSDINYIRKSTSLVNDALQKGCDIMQLANGDIVVTEVKTITYQYKWCNNTNKFERVTSGSRLKRRKEVAEAEAAND